MRASDEVGGTRPGALQAVPVEARLFLSAAAPVPDEVRVARLVEDAALEWTRLYELATRERAVGPLWRALRPVRDSLPPEFARALERAAAVEGIRQLQLQRRLVESLAALREVGVRPLLLKGGALLQTLYPDPRQRPMTDIDLLVEVEEAERARDALLDADWDWDRERFPEEMYRRHYHLPPLLDARGNGIGLELHTGLLLPGHPFTFGPAELRADARRVEADGETVLVPEPRSHLVYICLHFAWSHALGSGAWRTFMDVAAITGDGDFDWESFVVDVRAARGEAAAFWTLRLARDLGGVEVPDGPLGSLRPPLPEMLLERLARHYALGLFGAEASCPSVKMSHALWLLGNRWGHEKTSLIPGRGPIRPWEFSEDFRSLNNADDSPDGSNSRLGRHMRDRRRWRSYLGRITR